MRLYLSGLFIIFGISSIHGQSVVRRQPLTFEKRAITVTESGGSPRQADEDMELFEYTLGGLPPAPALYDIYSTGWSQFSLGLPPVPEAWVDASLSAYTTPAVLRIGIKTDKVPPPGAYTSVVLVTSGPFSLQFPLVLIVRPATSAASGAVVLPQFACGGGWSTTVYLTNAVNASKTINFSLHDNAGQPLPIGSLGSSRSVSLSPDGADAVTFAAADCPALREGYLKMTLPDGVMASAIFQQASPDGSAQEAVVSAAPGIASTALPFDETGTGLTALALVCTKAATGQSGEFLELTAHNRAGAILGTATVPLPANAKTTLVLRDRIPAVAGQVGSLKIRGTTGAFSALGLRFNGRAFTAIPVK